MRRNKFSLLSSLLLLLVLLSTSCKEDDPGDVVFPPDGDPQITLIEPNQSYALAYRGDNVSFTVRVDDNEQLNKFWVTQSWYTVGSVQYQFEDDPLIAYAPPKVISGTNNMETVNFMVPTTVIQDYSTIVLEAFVEDNKGKVASTRFTINVLPDTNGTGNQIEIQEYTTTDTIYCPANPIPFGGWSHFSFINRRNDDPISANWDIGYYNDMGTCTSRLEAPNQPGVDSVFALTNTSMFNYEELTYQTTWQAFVTSNQYADIVGPLAANDIVIVKLFNPPHFAIMKVENANAGLGFIIFKYKYTHN